MSGPGKNRIRRVVVPLDETPQSRTALSEALALAGRLRAELRGLFVEDVDLLHLADHPAAQVICSLTGTRQNLDSATLERSLRVALERIRRQLDEAAERSGIKASLDVRRGRLEPEVIAATEDGDLVIVEWSRPTHGRRRLPRGAARGLATEPSRSVLLWQPTCGLHGSVLAVYDGSLVSGRALDAAAALADRDGGEIGILLRTEEPANLDELQAGARAHIGSLRPHWLLLGGGGLADIARLARGNQAGVLVLPTALVVLAEEDIDTALDAAGCSVLLVG